MEKILFGSLLENIPRNYDKEVFEELFRGKNVKIERIVSNGQSSPKNFWYDQEENEFVLLLEGEAEIKFADGSLAEMKKGDWLFIPSHKKHRVERTDTENPTVWLAFFF
jgi:cupin 2 domain-containing protein